MAVAATEASLKPRQLQVARLRREEEEESWISGEELYTEGSSEDEAAHSRSPAHHPTHHPLPLQDHKCHTTPPTTPPAAASEPAQQNDPHLTETTRRLSMMGLENVQGTQKPTSSMEPEEVEEQEEVMLWRPKRGSIKLPHVELDPPSSGLLEQVSG
ncbi:hypothetical protein OTU49_011828 [Cherax quadricarinatus]|uniref:Uncharacterized protein n=2 Tax=Cherax quadricarinatus TaxID=27406 RepID=A0AAW0Y5K0_CHEQU